MIQCKYKQGKQQALTLKPNLNETKYSFLVRKRMVKVCFNSPQSPGYPIKEIGDPWQSTTIHTNQNYTNFSYYWYWGSITNQLRRFMRPFIDCHQFAITINSFQVIGIICLHCFSHFREFNPLCTVGISA